MAKHKQKENEHAQKADRRTDEELLNQGVEDEDLGLDTDEGDKDDKEGDEDPGFTDEFGEQDRSANKPAGPAVGTPVKKSGPSDPQRKESPGLPRPSSVGPGQTQQGSLTNQQGSLSTSVPASVITGLRDQVIAIERQLEGQTHPKLQKAAEHMQQARVWLGDFLRSK